MKLKSLFGIKSNKNKKNEITFKLPIKDIKDIIIGDNNTFKMVLRISPINGELAPDDMLKTISNAIQGALNSFEGRQGIYILSERVDIEENIKNIENRKLDLNDEFKISMLEEQRNDLQGMTNKSRTILVFYYVLEIKEKSYNAAEQILQDSYISIKNELESAEMFVEQLKEHEIKSMLYERMNPEESQLEKYREDWSLENIYPQNAVRYKDGTYLEIENRIYKFLAISQYPQYVNNYRWLKKLFNIKGDVNIAIILTPKNKATITKELSKAVEEVGGKALAVENNEALKQKYVKEEASAKKLVEELGSDNISLYDVNITIGISSNNKQELNTLSNIVRSKIGSSYLQSTEIKRKNFDPFYTILPLLVDNKITQNYVWNLTTKDVASIIPFDSSEFMESSGILIGENETSRGLVIANMRNKIYNNGHLCILADSGSGKTFFLMTQAIRNIPYVDYTIMFDIKGDLRFPFGSRHTFSATSGIIVNPFHIRNAIIDSDSSSEIGKIDVGVFLSQKIMDLIVFFRWIIPNMSPYDESLLEEDIRDCYKECGLTFESKILPEEFCTMATLDEVMNKKINSSESDMERERRKYLKACLKPYSQGTYSKIFNGQTNWDFDFFTVFDISCIPEAVKKPLYDILLKDTWQFAKKDGTINPTFKDIYVDECHEFADPENPQTLMFLSTKLSKQGRGFGVRLITATQNLPDFLSIPRYGQAIIDNSYFKLFMRLGESDLPVAQKLYSFSDNELKILKGTGNKRRGSKGKGIFIVGSQRVVIQTRASKFELEIIDPVQFKEIYNVNSRYMS